MIFLEVDRDLSYHKLVNLLEAAQSLYGYWVDFAKYILCVRSCIFLLHLLIYLLCHNTVYITYEISLK